MKHQWRKQEKAIYLAKAKPELINVPEFKYFTIEGEGNPNSEQFPEYIGVLYALSYAAKMSIKKGWAPHGYFDYTVYPLEGIWDINEETKKHFNGTINKNHLVFKLMIRQPGFVDEVFAQIVIEHTKRAKPHELLGQVKFETIYDGPCVQMMHIGSYDNEPESFRLMEEFAEKQDLTRTSKTHREIYLNDARKVAPEKLKTVLRFKVQ